MVYQWKTASYIKADAQTAGEQFEQLSQTVGLTPKTVLDANRPEDAPLHDEFEWDDSTAAEKYRENQARHLIQCICIKRDEDEAQSAESVRAYFTTTEVSRYEPLETIVTVPDKYQAMLDRAVKELLAFQRKYQVLTELQPVFAAIGELNAHESHED